MNKIICPYCGAEYLPSEIYTRDAFLGHPEMITKNKKGVITKVVDTKEDNTEGYKCDFCSQTFTVKVNFSFDVDKASEVDFSTDHVTPLFKSKTLFPEV